MWMTKARSMSSGTRIANSGGQWLVSSSQRRCSSLPLSWSSSTSIRRLSGLSGGAGCSSFLVSCIELLRDGCHTCVLHPANMFICRYGSVCDACVCDKAVWYVLADVYHYTAVRLTHNLLSICGLQPLLLFASCCRCLCPCCLDGLVTSPLLPLPWGLCCHLCPSETGLLVCRVHAHLLDQPCCDPCAGAHGRDNSLHHQKSCLLHCRNKGKLLSRSLHMPAHHTKSTAVVVVTGPMAPMIKRYTGFKSNKISLGVVANSAYLMLLLLLLRGKRL